MASTSRLPEILPAFLADHPRVNVDLQERPNAEIARGVLDGRADLGIVAGQVDTLGLQTIHFSTDRPGRARGCGARARSMHRSARSVPAACCLGKPMKLRIQLSSFDAMCRMIGAGVGIGIVPESAAQEPAGVA